MASLGDVYLSSDDGSSLEAEGFLKYEREYDNFRSFINMEEQDPEMSKGTLLGLNRYIFNNFKSWKEKKLVICITGNTGAGKSSLINALRGLKPKDKGAALVGVGETTREVQIYTYPGNDNLVLADYPGVGTKEFPKDQYMAKTKLLESGVVVIVSATRFTENDIWIAKEVLKVRKNILFVRTKIDSDLYNARADDPDNFSEYTCINTVRKEIETNLEKEDMADIRDKIFIVSSRDPRNYDFDSLDEKLKCLLNMKTKAICFLLYECMVKAIQSKTKQYESEFIGRKVASVITGFLPIPKLESTLDTYHVTKIWETCLTRYSIDTNTLEQFAAEMNMSIEDIQSQLKSYGKEISDGEQLHSETEDRKWLFVQKYSKYTVPGLGMFFSAYKSPQTMQECLKKICEVMASDEIMLLKLRLRKLEQDLMM